MSTQTIPVSTVSTGGQGQAGGQATSGQGGQALGQGSSSAGHGAAGQAGAPVGGSATSNQEAPPVVATPAHTSPARDVVSGWAAESLGMPKAVDPAAYQKNGQVDLNAYHQAVDTHRRVSEFRNGLIDTISAPVDIHGVTLAPLGSKEEVAGFTAYVNRILSEGVKPRDLYLLHRAEAVVKMARESGAVKAERAIQTAQPQQQVDQSQETVLPNQTQNPVGRQGQVPSTRHMFAELFKQDAAEMARTGDASILFR